MGELGARDIRPTASDSSAPRRCLAALIVVFTIACTPHEEARSAEDESQEPPTAPTDQRASWIRSQEGPRFTTVVVRVQRSQALKAAFERAAADVQDEALAALFRAQGSGGFGSGFVVARRLGDRRYSFVITNRHVIDGGGGMATIVFQTGQERRCAVTYIHATQDLAVLSCQSLDDGSGLVPSSTPARDLDSVIAAGYPAIGSTPSYQITEGKVSNAQVSFEDFGIKHDLIQHTAPIDPGSSGGPLMNRDGELVGVNVAFVPGRHALYLAIPADAVTQGVDAAIEVLGEQSSRPWLRKGLTVMCRRLARDLSAQRVGGDEMLMVSDDLVAAHGLASMDLILSISSKERVESYAKFFASEPLVALRIATLERIYLTAKVSGIEAISRCVANGTDVENIALRTPINVSIEGTRGRMTMSFSFEQGRWRVISANLVEKDQLGH